MTLPPTQNQYPGWEPPKQNAPQNINDFGASVPNSNNSNIPPVQNMQPSQPQAPQPLANNISQTSAFQPQPQIQSQPLQAFDNNQANQPISQPSADVVKSKKPFKGPLLLLVGMIVVFSIITALVLLTSKKPSTNNSNSTNKTINKASRVNNGSADNKDTTQPQKTLTDEDKESSNQPYVFVNNQQMANLKNLQTSLTTYQSQDNNKKLPTATPQGWAQLKANNIIDPVTKKPYDFTASSSPNVGEVQYAAQSICSSDNTIIASTDLGSFALRTRIYNGTYYCVDSSNARS